MLVSALRATGPLMSDPSRSSKVRPTAAVTGAAAFLTGGLRAVLRVDGFFAVVFFFAVADFLLEVFFLVEVCASAAV